MSGQRIDIANFSSNRHILTVNSDAATACHHFGPTRSLCLIPSKENSALGIGSKPLEMVKYSTAGRHTARGNDHLGNLTGTEAFRIVDASDVGGDFAKAFALFVRQFMINLMLAEYFARIDRHWAVQKDWHISKSTTQLDPLEVVEQRLDSTNSKRRNDHRTSSFCGRRDNLRDAGLGIDARMTPVAVRRTQQ